MKYILSVYLNKKNICSVENSAPNDFFDIKVYASNLWDNAPNASISKLFIENKVNGTADFINHREEFLLTRGLVLGTLTDLKKEYIVFFNLKPTSYSKGLKNVLLLSLRDNSNAYGDRNPGVWFHEDGSGKLIVCSSLSYDRKYCIETNSLTLGQWYNIKVCQSFSESKYWFSVTLDDVSIHSVENSLAKDFENITVFTSNTVDDAQNASISDVFIINGKPEYLVGNNTIPIERGKLIAQIPKLHKEHFISFDLYLNKNDYDNSNNNNRHNILHFTQKYDDSNRLLAIFYEEFDLQISVDLNEDRKDQSTVQILNSWINIEISQFLEGLFYIYKAKINGNVVYSEINCQFNDLDNVKVYVSSPWAGAQNSLIKNLFVVNSDSSSGVQPIAMFPTDHIDLKEEFTVSAGLLLGTLYTLKKVYSISFNLKPISYSKGLKSVLNLVLANSINIYGKRNPAVWFHQDGSGKLVICPAINGSNNYCIITHPLQSNQWHNIKIYQYLHDGKYWFVVTLNGITIQSVKNSDARNFENIKVYASNNWNNAQNCLISDLLIFNGNAEYIIGNINTPLVFSNVVAMIPMLKEEYLISFDISPSQFVPGKHSVIHFASSVKDGFDNYSILDIWSIENEQTYKLAVKVYNNSENDVEVDINKNNMLSIVVSQMLRESIRSYYLYTIKINGLIVYYEQKMNQPEIFKNVKVYASDLLIDVKDALIKNFFIINGFAIINCPDGWLAYENSCYLFQIKKNTWMDSNLECNKSGGSLLIVANEKEYSFIELNLKDNEYYIGLKAVKSDRNFVWSDGSPFVFKKWRPDEPNNINENEDCVVITSEGWNDVSCDNANGHICKVRKGINCPASWLAYENSCYFFQIKTNTWVDSNLECNKSGGNLLSVENEKEYSFIKFNLKGKEYYIGLKAVKVDRNFVWSDGSPLVFKKWRHDEPNNLGGNEECVVITSESWNDANCDNTYDHICKVKKDNESEIESQPIVVLPTDYISTSGELTPTQGLILGTLNVMKKAYTLILNIKPLSYTNGLKNVLHLTQSNAKNVYGYRNLGIWFHSDGSGKLVIYAAISGNSDFFIETNPLTLGQWSNVKIYQYLQNGNYWFAIDLNGVNVQRIVNTAAKDFSNVLVYCSNPWDAVQNVSISNLLFINKNAEYLVGSISTPLVKGKLIAEIKCLYRQYLVSFDIKPNQFVSGESNVVYFTAEGGTRNYNEMTPGIWFNNEQVMVFTNNGIKKPYNTDPIMTNMWSNVMLYQVLQGSSYVYFIKINEKTVYYENNNPQKFYNVKVYASDPWYAVQDASIKNFFIINGISESEVQPISILSTDYINYKEEFAPSHGTILGVLSVVTRVYTVSFNLKPTNYSNGYKNVLHLNFGGNIQEYGYSNPGIWFHADGSGKLVILSAINGKMNFEIQTDPLTLDEWSNIKIYQYFQDGQYWFTVKVNGFITKTVKNTQARDFIKMSVYASNLWDNVQNCLISDLLIINGKAEYLVGSTLTPLIKEKVVAMIPNLNMEYFVSLDVKPNRFENFNNVIHFTVGSDNFVIGDRVPGVWLKNSKFYIAVPIDGNRDFGFDSNPIVLNRWTNIKVYQFLNGSFYVNTIRVNEEIISLKVNNKPQSFDNVTVYASDPWSDVLNGSIKNLFIINGNSSSENQPVVFPPVLQLSSSSAIVVQFWSPSTNNKTLMIAILVPVLSVIFIFSIVVVIRMNRKKARSQQSKEFESNLNCGDLSPDSWEIFPEYIILDKKIGEGAFGTVFIAKISTEKVPQQENANRKSLINKDLTTNVAVKFLKDSADQSEYFDFCEEIKLMKEIGYHKNIVNMIGCSTIKKPLCLVVEFMENGDLLHFLRERRINLSTSNIDESSAASFMYVQQQTIETTISENCTSGVMPNEIALADIGLIMPEDLLSFAWQVASGMEYLTCKKLVHRDLAARNILVGAEKNVKISDFGLTRKVNNDLNYMSSKNRRLPVKWMSVEAIFQQKFTSYSDVWAYGVVLFEIVTLGGTPYPTINNRELLTLLKSGYRMERPENCSEFIYDIMLRCWNEDPLRRPTFTELREHLDGIISQGDCYVSFKVDEKNNYYNVASFNSAPCKTDDNPIEEEISIIDPS